MQFLKTLFWVALAIALVVFSIFNWTSVEIRLWGGLLADVKLPVLILAAFLLGFLPMLGFHIARVWRMQRRVDAYERQLAVAPAPSAEPAPVPAPVPERTDEARIATDSKVWPAS